MGLGVKRSTTVAAAAAAATTVVANIVEETGREETERAVHGLTYWQQAHGSGTCARSAG